MSKRWGRAFVHDRRFGHHGEWTRERTPVDVHPKVPSLQLRIVNQVRCKVHRRDQPLLRHCLFLNFRFGHRSDVSQELIDAPVGILEAQLLFLQELDPMGPVYFHKVGFEATLFSNPFHDCIEAEHPLSTQHQCHDDETIFACFANGERESGHDGHREVSPGAVVPKAWRVFVDGGVIGCVHQGPEDGRLDR